MALLTLMDKLVNALEKKEIVVGIFLDFSKAFDTVDHDILLRNCIIMVYEDVLTPGLKVTWPIELSPRNFKSNVVFHKAQYSDHCCFLYISMIYILYVNIVYPYYLQMIQIHSWVEKIWMICKLY